MEFACQSKPHISVRQRIPYRQSIMMPAHNPNACHNRQSRENFERRHPPPDPDFADYGRTIIRSCTLVTPGAAHTALSA